MANTEIEELKAKANSAFKSNRFLEAQKLYSEAIDLCKSFVHTVPQGGFGLKKETPAPTPETTPPSTSPPGPYGPAEFCEALAVLLGNRANTAIKLEQYASAIEDANSALMYNSKYHKAYYRKGTAYFLQSKYKHARKNYVVLTKLLPNDRDARNKLRECDKRIREIAFTKAIEADASSSSSSSSSSSTPSLSDVPTVGGVAHLCNTVNLANYPVDAKYNGPSFDAEVTLDFIRSMIETFRAQKLIHINYALRILLQARSIMLSLPNIVDLNIYKGRQITVCGDVHGQYYDLVDCIFKNNGLPSRDNPYVFNGDFVDRGSFSVEVILTLLAFKCYDPQCIHLIRGNHESLNMNKIYGFEGECAAKYSDLFFKCFSEFFQALPLAYTLHGKPYEQPQTGDGVGGGGNGEEAKTDKKETEGEANDMEAEGDEETQKDSQHNSHSENGNVNGSMDHKHEETATPNGDAAKEDAEQTTEEKQRSDSSSDKAAEEGTQNGSTTTSITPSTKTEKEGRRVFIVHGGLFSRDGVTLADIQELDRASEPEAGLMAEMLWSDPQDEPGWGPSKRGIGVAFGPDVTHRFLESNGLDMVVRSHEMKEQGYEVAANGKLITIFSAPNYCDAMGNKGAYITFRHDMQPEFHQFVAVPHPNVKPMQYASNMFFG